MLPSRSDGPNECSDYSCVSAATVSRTGVEPTAESASSAADASASADTTEAEAAQADIVLVPVDVPGDDKSAAASVAVPLVRGGAGEGLAGFLLLAVGAGLAAAGIVVLGLAWLDARPRGRVVPAE